MLTVLLIRYEGSIPSKSQIIFWAIGQTAKMSACHAVRSGFDSRIARKKFESLAATKLVNGDLDALIELLQ